MEVYRQYRAFRPRVNWERGDSVGPENPGECSLSAAEVQRRRVGADGCCRTGKERIEAQGLGGEVAKEEREGRGAGELESHIVGQRSMGGAEKGNPDEDGSPTVAAFAPLTTSAESADIVHVPPDGNAPHRTTDGAAAASPTSYSASSSTLPPAHRSASPPTHSPPNLIATWSPSPELDPLNPHNFSMRYKAFVILQLASVTLSMTYASAASSPASAGLQADFGLSEVGATASTSLFLIGMGLGAMPSAPLSELYGRFPAYIVTLALAAVFECLAARATSGAQHLAMRFLGGVFSSAPLSNAGGTLNDMASPLMRTLAFPLFATVGFVGPVLAPLFGAYLVQAPGYGWRWCFWLCGAWHGANLLMALLVMPETLGSMLLRIKAARLSKLTGQPWQVDPGPADKGTWWAQTRQALGRPFVMLVKEPILQLFTAYLLVTYIVLYGTFTAYPLIFASHGLSLTQIGLTFIPVLVGFLLLLLVTLVHFFRYRRLYRLLKSSASPGLSSQPSPASASASSQPTSKSAPSAKAPDATPPQLRVRGIHAGHIEPEERLVPLLCVNWLFPLGLFWLAFTSSPSFSLWVPLMSGVPFAIGLLGIFQGTMQYLIDAYGPFASSALAATTLVRYGLSGVVILAYPKMYHSLGNEWGTAVFGFVGLGLTAVPWGFYVYGRRIRARCRFTVNY